MKQPFTFEELEAADAWNFNCGPAAACAIADMTPELIRPHLADFEDKGYTNPTLMLQILRNLRIKTRQIYRADVAAGAFPIPALGLIRVQWDGPWTAAGVPMAARYRHTHWAALKVEENGAQWAFDVNAVKWEKGWLPLQSWKEQLIPWLIRQCEPKATGKWWPTHILEVRSEPL